MFARCIILRMSRAKEFNLEDKAKIWKKKWQTKGVSRGAQMKFPAFGSHTRARLGAMLCQSLRLSYFVETR